MRGLSETDAALVVLIAPPGYGKSPLLAQWTEHDGRPAVWLTFDERTGSSQAAAFRSILGALDQAGLLGEAPRGGHARRDPADAFRSAVCRLRAAGQDFILVLDDGHLAEGTILRALVDTVIAEAGEHSIVALACPSSSANCARDAGSAKSSA